MANLTESPIYEPGIFQLEKTTPPLGGAPAFNGSNPSAGHANVQALQLANRTAYLKQQLESLQNPVVRNYTEFRNIATKPNTVDVIGAGIGGRFVLDSEDTTSLDNGGTTIVTLSGDVYKRQGVQGVNPLMFGAKSDQNVNSTDALKRTFDFANSNHIPVTYEGMSEVLIDRHANITIRVSTDFSGCKHFLNNSTGSTKRLYLVSEDEGVNLLPVTVSDQSTLVRGAPKLNFTTPLGAGFLYLNSTRQLNPRVSNGTVLSNIFYRQVFSIDRDGVLNEPLEADFTTGTQGVDFTFTYKPFSKNGWIKICNLVVDDDDARDQGIILVQRSLVDLENFDVPSEVGTLNSAEVSAIISTNLAAKVNIQECYVGGRPATNTATYAFSFTYTADLTVTDCSGWGQNTWGSILTTYTNGVKWTRCKFRRIDAHECLMNWDITNCESFYDPVQYGFGYGYLRVKNCVIHNNDAIIKARGDYGGDFQGVIEVDGIVWRVSQLNAPQLSMFLSPIGGTLSTVNIAYQISFKNIHIEYSGTTPITVIGINTYNNPDITGSMVNQGYRKPKEVSFENITCTKGDFVFTLKNVFQFGMAADTSDKTTTWNFRRVMSRGYKTTDFFISNNTARTAYQDISILGNDIVRVFDCPDVMIQLAKPGVDFYIADVPKLRAVANWRGASAGGNVYIRDCIIADTVAISAMNLTQGEFGAGASVFTMYNTRVSSTCNFSNAKALQGVTIDNGVTLTMPSGVTANTAFTGYKASIFQ